MITEKYAVIIVHATSHALRAEKLIRNAGIQCRLIPVPRYISSDCGVCLRLKKDDKENAVAALKNAAVEIDSVHTL